MILRGRKCPTWAVRGTYSNALRPECHTLTLSLLRDSTHGGTALKLSDCIADYLNHIRHERGHAKTTCLHYQCWLRAFTRWLEENGYPDADVSVLSLPVLRRYQYAKAKTGV